MKLEVNLQKYRDRLRALDPIQIKGKVIHLIGPVIEGQGPACPVGEMCEIYPNGHEPAISAEVVGFKRDRILLMPLGEMRGVGPGSTIVSKGQKASVRVGPGLLGRVLDGLGEPLDHKGPLLTEGSYPLYAGPLNPLHRRRISEPLDLGVRAINGLLTCGKGQRMGIFAGSGVGKSMLLGMIARNTMADVNVIALIGERSREVKEFIDRDLGEAGLARSVVVAATADQPPVVRIRGAFVATAIAEYFRDRGKQVILMMDSLTRFAMAQREVGLAIGEPPTAKGYTSSVFSLLPKLLERAGASPGEGCITGLYTVLVEGDDINEPIPDAVRAILDGHIILSRELAIQDHYPAIDILQSTSRVMMDIVAAQHKAASRKVIEVYGTYKRAEDLIQIGAYKKGSDPRIDHAIGMIEKINAYLRQEIHERVSFQDSVTNLFSLVQSTMAP